MNLVPVTAHCNKVVLTVREHGNVILSTVVVTVREEDAIGCHCAKKVMNAFSESFVPQGFADIQAY